MLFEPVFESAQYPIHTLSTPFAVVLFSNKLTNFVVLFDCCKGIPVQEEDDI